MVLAVTTLQSSSASRGAPNPVRRGPAAPSGADQLEQLRFLHEIAKLATTARTWDELLETVVDRTRDVLNADAPRSTCWTAMERT